MGRPRKPTEAHVIEGTFNTTRHGDRPDLSLAVENSKPVEPSDWDKYDPLVKEVWDFYINRLYWNGEVETHLFLRFCHMTADHLKFMEGERTEYDWKPSMLSELSKLSAALGVGYSERMKVPPRDDGSEKGKEKEDFD